MTAMQTADYVRRQILQRLWLIEYGQPIGTDLSTGRRKVDLSADANVLNAVGSRLSRL